MVRLAECIVLFVVVDIASTLVNNTQIEARNALQDHENRRKGKSDKSTSSDSKSESADKSKDSIDVSETTSDSKSTKDKNNEPKSSTERKGWIAGAVQCRVGRVLGGHELLRRKWHRKCKPCPEDAETKWRDPTISWICGGYQRARRSFKSTCMMHYRNCQDGTMFVKIHNLRCANSSNISPHGDHFFYDYKALMPDETKSSDDTSSSDDTKSSD